ncbi:hypothetical protein H5P28_11570 [Ruficoccus amylovorans]|uniref:Uncharacterized protein n=1 Tax=Ruficoccus amylovorans TaxID=1804625 RepID=A0A842HGZ7_9BACT|nr:hypothetical protein [Ruficoccus amylovorans]MBC2594896.1 hypothetical protein [Ruficoccus amylovorans]
MSETTNLRAAKRDWRRKATGYFSRSLRGDCVICGFREDTAIHSRDWKPGQLIAFHAYTPALPQYSKTAHRGHQPKRSHE